MRHKHHEHEPGKDHEPSDEERGLEIRSEGKALAKKILEQQEKKLGRQLTEDEKLELLKKTIKNIFKNPDDIK